MNWVYIVAGRRQTPPLVAVGFHVIGNKPSYYLTYTFAPATDEWLELSVDGFVYPYGQLFFVAVELDLGVFS